MNHGNMALEFGSCFAACSASADHGIDFATHDSNRLYKLQFGDLVQSTMVYSCVEIEVTLPRSLAENNMR